MELSPWVWHLPFVGTPCSTQRCIVCLWPSDYFSGRMDLLDRHS